MQARFSTEAFPVVVPNGTEPDKLTIIKLVHIVDENDGGKTITNDAEAVVEHLLRLWPGLRFFYTDTDGNINELKHDGTKFTGFGPGPGFAGTYGDWIAFFASEGATV